MKRKEIKVRKSTLREQGRDVDLKDKTPSQRFAMVHQLTVNAWAFKGEHVGQQRLQRHIERIYKRKI